eukprot:CAMPEP_0172569822 /NCGR_PEP_ID=MMETSP1067-20121228/125103_1 /TAXON_ID=265564 ORGANISM="Thalassiosira punctigera, Strain Tpunct2005C2" /NCGR_SAMPLE_ID=MMETSP1067 /ASSEMBLY_ACC=CAM_ASM_000444 /LENGTH=53 /DNA_ID=CAMNT_0013361749 /DNA_START=282 /DNA_END=443 /DNA_ORIENTATION=-
MTLTTLPSAPALSSGGSTRTIAPMYFLVRSLDVRSAPLRCRNTLMLERCTGAM